MNRGGKQAKHSVSFEITTASPEETARIGSNLASVLEAGAVILLIGDLGVGKTVFAQGVARGLGVDSPVTSPTYTLVSEYDGRSLPFYHLDLYRLNGDDPFEELGAEEYLSADGVTAIEWPEKIQRVWHGDCITVTLEHLVGDSRRIEIQSAGSSSIDALESYLKTFAEPGANG